MGGGDGVAIGKENGDAGIGDSAIGAGCCDADVMPCTACVGNARGEGSEECRRGGDRIKER